MLLYGWTAQYHVHWMAPIIGIVIFGMGVVFAMVRLSGPLWLLYTLS